MSCCSHNSIPAATAACANQYDLTDSCSTVYYAAQQCPDSIIPHRGCNESCDCTPIPETPLCAREYRLCVDQNGCATRYPAECRNHFWPNFSHPRWLPCSSLYCTQSRCRNCR